MVRMNSSRRRGTAAGPPPPDVPTDAELDRAIALVASGAVAVCRVCGTINRRRPRSRPPVDSGRRRAGKPVEAARRRAVDPPEGQPMPIEIEAIHHVGLVVRDREAAERFYIGILGLERVPGRPSWLRLHGNGAIHLIPLGTGEAEPRHHWYRHVALQVADLRQVLGRLLDHGVAVTQADFRGGERAITAFDDPLDYGTGSLFASDPDGNTIEFLQLGRGIFGGA